MLTLGTQRDLTNDVLIKGIIDSVVTVNQFYQMLPFKGIQGNALAYSRESTQDQQRLVNVFNTGVNSINKDSETFTRESTELTTIIGDAQVNGLVQAVGSDYHDATAVQVAAKAKGIGRRYMDLLIHGNEGGTFEDDQVVLFSVVRDLLVGARARLNGADITAATTAANLADATAIITVVPATGTVRSAVSVTRIVDTIVGTGVTQTVAVNGNDTTGGAFLLNIATAIVNGFTGFDGLNAFVGNVTGSGTMNRTNEIGIDLSGGTNGNALLSRLDEYVDAIHDKDGMVDYIMMNSRGVRKYTTALRSVGAAGYDDVMEIKNSSGGLMKVQSYRGVPIFRNDFVGGNAFSDSDAALRDARSGVEGGDLGVQVTTDAGDDIYVGTIDDGSMTHGICGLTAKNAAGMQVQKLGAREDVDADITRVKWYCGLAHFSELGLLRGTI